MRFCLKCCSVFLLQCRRGVRTQPWRDGGCRGDVPSPRAHRWFLLLFSCRSQQFPGERRDGPHPENNGGPPESEPGVSTWETPQHLHAHKTSAVKENDRLLCPRRPDQRNGGHMSDKQQSEALVAVRGQRGSGRPLGWPGWPGWLTVWWHSSVLVPFLIISPSHQQNKRQTQYSEEARSYRVALLLRSKPVAAQNQDISVIGFLHFWLNSSFNIVSSRYTLCTSGFRNGRLIKMSRNGRRTDSFCLAGFLHV